MEVFITIATTEGMYPVTAQDLKKLKRLTSIDVEKCLREIKDYMDAYPDKRKSRKEMPIYIDKWLEAVESGKQMKPIEKKEDYRDISPVYQPSSSGNQYADDPDFVRFCLKYKVPRSHIKLPLEHPETDPFKDLPE